jgi:DNA-directed RNA polymerase subunit RPC12/RpoP
MRRKKQDWSARIQHWETFFHHFLAYIFHTEAGKQIRWRFLREMLFRTITYTLAAFPVMVILWYYHLFSGDSSIVNLTLALLIFDFAFGLAFLRTVYFYRHRVYLLYEDPFATSAPHVDDMPISHRPTQQEAAGVDDLETAEEFPLDIDDDQMQELLQKDWTKGGPAKSEVPRVMYECNRCHRRIMVLVTETMTETRCECGGKIRER